MSLNTQIITSRTSGSGNSASQVFLSNNLANIKDTITSPFYFDAPVYTLNGATFNYYMQTTDGISASLNNIKSFTFLISANTNSLSGTTKMRHDIYRIDYNTFTAFTITNFPLTSTTVNPFSLPSGLTSNTITTISPNSASAVTEASVTLAQSLAKPFYTVFEEVSGSTFLVGTAHTMTLPQKVKPDGLYTQDLFVDKAQYFIDSTFVFEQPVNQTLGDVQMYSGNQVVQLYNMPYSSSTYVQTANKSHVITGGTFSGVSISGASFTYFVPPKKADIFVVDGSPAVQGSLNTFAPIFAFKNVEDGDYYKVEVTYNTGDTSFTGETTTFKFEAQPGNAEYVRAVAAAVTPNSEFLYRIGNTKEIINLFTVKQNVTTWSEFTYAKAANDGTFLVSGHTWLNKISGSPVSNAIISLTVETTISAVDLGSDALSNPDVTSEVTNPLGGGAGSVIAVASDNNGYFTFGKINGGQYTITAQHPDAFNFPPQTISIYITTETNLDFVFSLLWGNTSIDFQQPYTFL